MKKITQKLFFLMLSVLSISAFAQTTNSTGLPGADLIFYEDMRYIGGTSGFAVTETTVTESAAGNSTVPVDGLAAGELGYARPANNYPVGDAVDNRSARLKGNNGSANYDNDVWFVVNSQDLSAYDAGSKYFTFSTRSAFREDGGTNIDDDTTIWYTTGFATGSDPTAASWTAITATPVGSSAAMGADAEWTTQSVDLSAITCGTQFAIAIRRQSSSTGPAGGAYSSATNRNGTWFLSDIIYTGSTTPLSVSDDVLSKAISIYPNPAEGRLNISKLDASINIKSTTLFDITGKEIYNTDFAESIDVSKFSPGLYLLKLESQEGGVSTKKVVIE